ncbi:toll-like receptor 13 isoform X1 [Dicentrarchus labrax]|uniref:toll-like receptor 13 isoform X1 n=1 Tax=Dicentrarchus labrax TaxID=13489 RepID=UPI0021F6377B|nr:toll-like receptor 13 isoform X1 [Dicentrarchus labrax]
MRKSAAAAAGRGLPSTVFTKWTIRDSLLAGRIFKKMGPGVKEDQTMPEGRLKCSKLSIIFFLLNVSNFVVPGTGFAMRSCRISYNIAICKGGLRYVPQDVPSTVKGFDLSSNKISKIRVSDFKSLSLVTQIDLSRNNILHIDTGSFADLISLKRLNLNNNKLVELADDVFKGLSNLTELRIISNKIKVVASTSFRSLTSLNFLDISYNKLDNLTKVNSILQHLPNLRVLIIKNINLTTFHSWELTNSSLQLTSLDLSQNPITKFSITEDVFPNLTWFNIGGYQKPMTWDVRNQTFLSRVSSLDISGLQVTFEDMKTLLESVNSSLNSIRMYAMKYKPTALINVTCTIPTMSTLKFRRNKLSFISSNLFHLCINVTELDLGDNKIKTIKDEAFRSIKGLRILTLSRNKLPTVPAATRNIPTLAELDLSSNNITRLECYDFANLTKLRQLNLYLNQITTLQECVFKDLKQLQVLKLQNNHISKITGAFKKYLPSLKQLRLNANKITTIKHGEFMGLQSLQNLSLHDNQIHTLNNGCFIGLTSLTDIQLQSNDIKTQEINSIFNDVINLRRLDLRNNHIKYDHSSALPHPPFSQLSLLETLAIPAQHSRGKAQLPCNILQGLTNLLVFNTRNSQLLSLPRDMFNYTPQLQTLDVSSNDLVDFSPDIFHPIQNLKSLYISRTSLRSLDFLNDAGLTKLEFMQARKNEYSVISEKVMDSLPSLIYVDFQGNSFTCDCNNAWFLQWIENNKQTQVFDAYRFECNYPTKLKGTKLLDFDIQFCTVRTEFICFVSTTCITILFMVASFTYHFLRWQLAYAYYYFLALLLDTKNKNKQAPYHYDAFISYNTHDEPWVIRELLPKLEGEQGWRLCLHHRDFEPGRAIIDNITDAIYGSRKTICVISRKYLESEWCSKEIQVASFRLFDERKDVLILVFLEDISTFELSPYHRMRRLLKRWTYLSWPQAEEHTELFWEKLRQALTTTEDHAEDRFLLTVMDRP